MIFLKVDWYFLFGFVLSTQGGLNNTAKLIPVWPEKNLKNGSIMYAINVDDQLKIELPLTTSGSDLIQGKELWFLPHCVWPLDSNTNISTLCFYSCLIVANF